jgi:branched-chain amino acid transport system permease protein
MTAKIPPATAPAVSDPRRATASAAPRVYYREYLGPLLLALAAVSVLASGNAVYLSQMALVGIYAIAAVGQQWVIGAAGQASIGAAAFMGTGAFTAAIVAKYSWAPFPVPFLVAGVVGAAVGIAVGMTALRLRGLYLLLSTLALQYIVSFIMQRSEGSAGALFIFPPSIAGATLNAGRAYDIVILVVLAVVAILMNFLYRSPLGRTWSAIRQNEQAASVVGINVMYWKLMAFAGSAAITAIAGAVYAYQLESVSYQAFSLNLAISVLVMVYVGGRRSIAGTILGAALVSLLPYALHQVQNGIGSGSVANWLTTNGPNLDSAIYGAALVVIMLFERDGLAGLLAQLRDSLIRAARRPRGRARPATSGEAQP